MKIVVNDKSAEGELNLIPDPVSTFSAEDKNENSEAVARTFRMQEELATLMDSVMAEKNILEPVKDAASVVAEYLDSIEAIRGNLVPVKTGRSVLFADEERLRDKVTDVYFGVNFYEGRPTTSQSETLNKLQRDMNTEKQKLEERKKVYRPKVKEEIGRAHV